MTSYKRNARIVFGISAAINTMIMKGASFAGKSEDVGQFNKRKKMKKLLPILLIISCGGSGDDSWATIDEEIATEVCEQEILCGDAWPYQWKEQCIDDFMGRWQATAPIEDRPAAPTMGRVEDCLADYEAMTCEEYLGGQLPESCDFSR